MAAQTDVQRLLFGGMELIEPADKLVEGNSLICQNFRSDKNNYLLSRQGSVKRAGPVGSGSFHTLKRFGANVYAGIGTALHHGPTLGSEIATGFDGEVIGLASQGGAVWAMNRAKRKRIVGAETYKWGVDAPLSAPTAEGGGQITNTLDEFQSGSTVLLAVEPAKGETDRLYAMQSGAPVDNDYAEADFSGDNNTLKVKILTATSVSCYTENGGALTVNGQSQDEDVIRVRVYCSNPRALDSVTVFAKAGGGYVEFAITDVPKFLNQAMDSWTEIKIRRRLNLDDWAARITAATKDGNQQTISDLEAQFATAIQTPTFVYTGSGWPQTSVGTAPPAAYPPSQAMLDMTWGGIERFGVAFKAKEAVTVGVGKAEAVGTVGENSIGEVNYFVSYLNIFGEDGNPSPASNPVVVGNQTITLTGIPVSDDPFVTSKYIWRSGGGLSQTLRVAVIGNAQTTWQDLTTNRVAQRDNVVMPIDRDLPPAARGVIGPIYGKLIAFNTDAHPSRYFWTPAGEGWHFPGADDDAVGNWEDAGSPDDGIIVATDHRPVTVFYKERSIWRVVGDPESNDPVQTNAHGGVFGPNAVAKYGSVDYYGGPEGVFRFNMDYEEKLSEAIDPIFKGDYVQLYDGTLLPPISLDAADKTCVEVIGDRLRLSYAQHGFSQPNIVAILHLGTGRWFTESYTNLQATAFSAMFNEGKGAGRGFIAGCTGGGAGYLYQLETAGFYFDDNQSARGIWQSRFYHQGLPQANKVYLDLEIDCQTRLGSSPDSPLTVSIIYDNGTVVALGTISSASSSKPRFTHVFRLMAADGIDVGRTGKNFAVRVECDIFGAIAIYGIAMHWYPEERVARSFDTGITNFGISGQVKQVDHVEFYMTAAGQALKRRFYSDLPGNLLASRESLNFSAPAGRGTFRKRLDAIVEGRNFRLTLSDSPSGSTYQVHQARARMRTIGEYLDGSNNEYFESAEFSIAPGRVGELKDFLLDYDVSGEGGRLEIYSDLPSNAMELRRTFPIPARTRAPYVFPMEDPSLTGPSDLRTALPSGQLFKVRIYPPAGGILRLHGRAMFRARLIGVYFDGRNREMWETQPLDLVGGMALFREISIVTETGGPMTLEMSTELPGRTMRVAASIPVDTSLTGQLPVNGRLPGSTKGRLQQFRLVGPYVGRVLSCKVLARRTEINDSPWDWIQVPLEATSNSWAEINVPMRQTSSEFTWVDLPVDPIS